MNFCRTAVSICIQNLRKWGRDYRIWCIFSLLFIIIEIYIDDIKKISFFLECDIPVWIFPFMYSQFYTKVLFTAPIILMFCNAPFIDGNQLYIYIRCGRKQWISGQILYIFAAGFIYYLFILAMSVIITLMHGGIISEWGKVLTTAAKTNTAYQQNCPYVEVSDMILNYFTPFQAVQFTFIVSWSNAVLLGMIIFMCNYLTKTKFLGISVSSAIIVFSWYVINSGYPILIKYSPTSWITLDNIDIGGKTDKPSFLYCMMFYWISIVLMISLTFLLSRKKGFDTGAE